MTKMNVPTYQTIPHLKVTVGGYNLSCPVRIKRALYGLHEAETDKNGYVYALPGNGRINSLGVIL